MANPFKRIRKAILGKKSVKGHSLKDIAVKSWNKRLEIIWPPGTWKLAGTIAHDEFDIVIQAQIRETWIMEDRGGTIEGIKHIPGMWTPSEIPAGWYPSSRMFRELWTYQGSNAAFCTYALAELDALGHLKP